MAKKVGVLDSNQLPNSVPSRYVKKTVAELLVRRLLAKRIDYDLIHMVVEKPSVPVPACRFIPAPRIYIPPTLPPIEGSGCRFQAPATAAPPYKHVRPLILEGMVLASQRERDIKASRNWEYLASE